MSAMHPRELALQRGARTYIGVACKHCGCRERYTANWDCTKCRRGRERAKKASVAPDRERERAEMRARLALVRAAATAKQRRAMGIEG